MDDGGRWMMGEGGLWREVDDRGRWVMGGGG